MQFKHPELLWALLVLLIPIIVHLFQLRRFKKTPFTNVAMLQKVVAESRKSSTIKKWLLLFTRMALLSCLVIAFAQPFFANKDALKENETVIYLDNSFSMQGKKDGLSLLEKSIQDFLRVVPDNTTFTLFTNDKTYAATNVKAIQNALLTLSHTHRQLTFDEVIFKAKTLFSDDPSSLKSVIVISDFQDRLGSLSSNDEEIDIRLVQLTPDDQTNVAIDSVYLGNRLNNQIDLHAVVTGLKEQESLPISLFNGSELIAKTAIVANGGPTNEVVFSIPQKETIKGKLVVNDNGLVYDDRFYFNIDESKKIKVLTIHQTQSDFLERIFTSDEFELSSFQLEDLNYSLIESQNLVVLNGLEKIPTNLQTALKTFESNGGSLLIIPSVNGDLTSYNTLLSGIGRLRFQEQVSFELPISQIVFDHPLYQNVFEKRVVNFEYPTVKSYYKTNNGATSAISYANGAPFLLNTGNTFVFTASLERENSNFNASPLIVPTIYNIGALSLKMNDLYFNLGEQNQVDIAISLEKDHIVSLKKDGEGFIPQQQSFANKLNITFADGPEEDGIYSVMTKEDTLQHLSFNYRRSESILTYQNIQQMQVSSITDTIPELFMELAENNSINNYWKWFVIFALVFALVELLIQKFLA